MDGLKISEVAERTGLTASAPRFYENAGIVAPARAANGYRAYTPADVESLLFVTRAKAVGLSLEEIGDLLELRDADRCGPWQDRLSEMIATRLVTTRSRIAELAMFAEDLGGLHAGFGAHRPDGPCDDSCGCLTLGMDAPAPVALGLNRASVRLRSEFESCTLERSEVPERLERWRQVLAGCGIARDATGATITLETADLGDIAALISAETECCSFFVFELTIDSHGRRLRVNAPDAQQPMVDLLIGAAS